MEIKLQLLLRRRCRRCCRRLRCRHCRRRHRRRRHRRGRRHQIAAKSDACKKYSFKCAADLTKLKFDIFALGTTTTAT